MKTSTKRLLAVAALLAATLCALSADALRAGGVTHQTAPTTLRVNSEAVPASFDVETKDGNVTGMTAVKKDGSRVAWKAQSQPTCPTSCPSDQKLSCWEDKEQQMSVCVCVSSVGRLAGSCRVVIRVDY